MIPTLYQSVETQSIETQGIVTRRGSLYLRPMSAHFSPDEEFWVFGYGSLMWNPGFPFVESAPALLYGYHRRLCILSTHYRGSEDAPGLVLGLDRGGSCCGRAFRVAPAHVNDTLAYLDEREQITKVYCPHFACVKLSDGREVRGYTFVVRREHPQYVDLTLDEQARMVAAGVGSRGTAFEYLANTVSHIDELGVTDTDLHRVLKLAQTIRAVSDESTLHKKK